MYESKTARVRPDEPVCLAVVDAVSDVTSTDPLALDPLGDIVDTDVLDTLFGSADPTDGCDVDLRFRYAGCDVRIEADGVVSVVRTPEPSDGTDEEARGRPAAVSAPERTDSNVR